eukprot:m.170492 g.170492  ORF g.170492 m.170492 type:complete len:76 (+) comp39042_c3_seq14:427-654(+)
MSQTAPNTRANQKKHGQNRGTKAAEDAALAKLEFRLSELIINIRTQHAKAVYSAPLNMQFVYLPSYTVNSLASLA